MSSLIVRKSLVNATISALRERILHGQFGEHLLPERQLCLELGVSRPTLRTALKQLEQEGLLSVTGRRLGRQILRPNVASSEAARALVVRMLQNHVRSSFLNEHLQTQAYLAENLRGPRAEFHVETAPSCFGGKPEKALEAFVRSRPASLWILYLSTERMQRWFQEQRIPTILFGSRFEGINFVSVEEDYKATCRHAAGVFLARGHRHLAFIASELNRPGDIASREGFESAVQNPRRDDISCHVALHDETVQGICKSIDGLLRRPKVSTAWLVVNTQTYFTVITHLARLRLQAGKDISLICRNSDPYFESVIPSVAHYRRNVQQINQYLVKAVQHQLTGEPEGKQQFLSTAVFCDGGSLGPG